MRTCVYCKIRYRKGSGITFHKFPNNSSKQLWLNNLKMEKYSLKDSDHLCSKHFTKDCFVRHASRISLRYGSVPTIFIDTSTSSVIDNVNASTSGVFVKEEINETFSGIDVHHDDTKTGETATSSSVFEDTITSTPCTPEEHGAKEIEFCNVDVYHDETGVSDAATIKLETTLDNIPIVRENVKHVHHYNNLQSRSISDVCTSIIHDHRYGNSPRSTKVSMQRLKRSLYMSRARVKVLLQQVKRLKTRVSSLKTKISKLEKKRN